MNNILIFDNLLPDGYINYIEKFIRNDKIDWHYVRDATYHTTQGYSNTDGAGHLLYSPQHTSKFYNFFKPILYAASEAASIKVEMRHVFRARLGLLMKAYPTDPEYNLPHVDADFPHWTGLYYVNDNDGPTYIFNERITDLSPKKRDDNSILEFMKTATVDQAVEPKKGRFVLFDGLRFHASSKPKSSEDRMVITFNWRPSI